MALIDFNLEDDDQPSNSAANRLRTITLKLKIMESTPEILRAVSEFDDVLSKHERSEKKGNILTWMHSNPSCGGMYLLIGSFSKLVRRYCNLNSPSPYIFAEGEFP